jgi:hypothetical protein
LAEKTKAPLAQGFDRGHRGGWGAEVGPLSLK